MIMFRIVQSYIRLRMLDPGDNMLDSMLIEERLESMLCHLTLTCRNELCAVVRENLPGDPIPCKSHFQDKNSIPGGGRIEDTVAGDQPG